MFLPVMVSLGDDLVMDPITGEGFRLIKPIKWMHETATGHCHVRTGDPGPDWSYGQNHVLGYQCMERLDQWIMDRTDEEVNPFLVADEPFSDA